MSNPLICRVAVSMILPLLSACSTAPTGGGDSCPTPPQRSPGNGRCTLMAGACPHRGGDEIHNECADRVPPNVVWNGMIGGQPGRFGDGCDVSYSGREFDALSWDSKMRHLVCWEIKTADWSGYAAFPKMCEFNNDVRIFIEDCTLVMECNHGISDSELQVRYVMAVADQPLAEAINEYIAQNTDKLPLGYADYCRVDNVQSCWR